VSVPFLSLQGLLFGILFNKDRRGRMLDHGDLTHYRRVVAALGDTICLMAEVDEAIASNGGWPLT
jgi:hypothetical protein